MRIDNKLESIKKINELCLNKFPDQLLVGEIEVLSNGDVYTTMSVDPSASVRDALKNPTFNLSTEIFEKN